ncbi:MAG: rod-binding protein [Deltaproteobacteria bacterium]|nr:rod-binding protein [Deltaproteobacteria bacterium]
MNAIDSVGIPTELSLGKMAEGKTDEATALRNFEAYFLGEMMRIAAPENPTGLFDGGQAGRMYREHFHQELARMVAESGGVGLAASMAGQLTKPGDEEKITPEAERASKAVRPEEQGR